MAQDPSSTVPPDLMPHVHLVSSFRYPSMPGLDLKDVAKFLMNAPLIARDKAPFFWTYLDRPADGTTLMTWQPLGRLSTNFATDGFVWAPPEQIYKHDLGNGLLLEIYFLKAGYIPGEQVAAHARRRFRLVPGPNHPNPASVDTSLFIVHYGPSDPNERIPANAIPYDERVNTIMQQRHFLQRAGQIRRKEFMLSDRANWPSLPELARQQGPPQMGPRGVPQQMAYPPQPAGPPAKRARHSQAGPGQQQPPPGAAHPDPFDDDEDVYRGDMFDHLTPREVSYSRYQQNHEWMEEILSSPYRAGQITPADLGIGLKGELASLTEGIFASQGVDAFAVPAAKSYTGKLDAGEADKFKERVGQYIESTNAELEKMKEEHAKALQEFRESGSMRAKERELKAVLEETGPEVWRIEGRVDPTEDDGAVAVKPSKQTIDDIVKDVEASLGQKIESKAKIDRVAAGGWQEPPPEPEPEPEPEVPAAAEAEDAGRPSQAGSQSDLLMEGGDMDMGDDTAGGLLDQMHTGFSSTSTPNNNFPTPGAGLSAGQSAAGTPNPSAPSPAPAAAPQAASDVQMGGTEAKAGEGETAPDQGTGSGDWVVVPKEGDAAGPGAVSGAPGAAPAPGPDAQQQQHQAPKPASTEQSAKATPIGGTPGGSGSFDQNDFGSIDDLNTAGDAMSGFDDGGDDLQMDMEDSAFGDAFHGVGDDGTPGGEGM